jgi:hypothetical protein
VFLNLVLNARDAMPRGGELRIESSAVELDSSKPAGRLYRPGRYVRLRISDTGAGMDREAVARVFEPFFTTKQPGNGTGLGMAVVHSIITQAGGYISAASEPGKGSTFEILLPCIGTFRKITEFTGERAAAGDPPLTILLVEDEDAVRRQLHAYLERQGYQLLEASSAEAAELIAETYEDPIHVLVTDVVMPCMAGPQLAERLVALRPDMKVLFITGYRHDHLASSLSINQGINVLPKPFPPAELVRRIRAMVAADSLSGRKLAGERAN